MKITITRALAELKSLTRKYDEELESFPFLSVKKAGKLVGEYSRYEEGDFIKHANSQYKSLTDILNRVVKIKKAVVASNQVTKVIIGGVEMTVQDALIEKDYLSMKENLLTELKNESIKGTDKYNTVCSKVEDEINAILKDKDSKSVSDLRVYLEKANKVEIVDPIKIDEKIKELETKINDFKTNVDYALSESNSCTYIEIED